MASTKTQEPLPPRYCGTCGNPETGAGLLVRRPEETPKDWNKRKFCSRRCSSLAATRVDRAKRPASDRPAPRAFWIGARDKKPRPLTKKEARAVMAFLDTRYIEGHKDTPPGFFDVTAADARATTDKTRAILIARRQPMVSINLAEIHDPKNRRRL